LRIRAPEKEQERETQPSTRITTNISILLGSRNLCWPERSSASVQGRLNCVLFLFFLTKGMGLDAFCQWEVALGLKKGMKSAFRRTAGSTPNTPFPTA
jgi:hypothetical protein